MRIASCVVVRLRGFVAHCECVLRAVMMTYNVVLFACVVLGEVASHSVLDFLAVLPDDESGSRDSADAPGNVCH